MLNRVLEPEFMDTVEEAEGYDAMDHADVNVAFVERLVELGARGSMLDIGTGPGHIPLLVVERIPGCRILGVDMARTMLGIAEKHRAASTDGSRIRYEVADAKELPYRDGEFDTVFSNTILHHIPDPVPYLREAYRVMKPDGVLLIRDLFRPDSEPRLEELVDLHTAGESEYQTGRFRQSLWAALTLDELREAAVAAGIEGHELVQDTDRHMSLQIGRNRE